MWLHQRATDLSPVHPPEKWKWTNTIRCEDGQAPVAHACNPSYSGGRDQEDRGSRPPRKIVPRDPYSKKPFTKKGLVEWLKVVSEFKPQYCSKKKKDVKIHIFRHLVSEMEAKDFRRRAE
jgi:hypothetical protein